jgi:hypothetical protein
VAVTCITQITKEWEQKSAIILTDSYVHRNYPGSFHILNFTDFYITAELCNLEKEEMHPYKISYTSIMD